MFILNQGSMVADCITQTTKDSAAELLHLSKAMRVLRIKQRNTPKLHSLVEGNAHVVQRWPAP
jgi:hypothetical protein